MIKKLIDLADYLDQNNLSAAADKLDSLLKNAAYSKRQLEVFDGDGDGKPFEREDFAALRRKKYDSADDDLVEELDGAIEQLQETADELDEVSLEDETINESVRSGDWIIRAMTRAQEEYVVTKEKFPKLYETDPIADGPDGFKVYKVKPEERRAIAVNKRLAMELSFAFPGVSPLPNSPVHKWLSDNADIIPVRKRSKVFAKQSDGSEPVPTKVEESDSELLFEFEAPWGGTMPAKEDDILIMEDNQFYRVARAEFDQTYESGPTFSSNDEASQFYKNKRANSIVSELADLTRLANRLDAKGLVKEADYVDMLIKTSDKYQEDWDKAWEDIYKGLDDAKRPDVEWPDLSELRSPDGNEPGSSAGPDNAGYGGTGPGSSTGPDGTGTGGAEPGSSTGPDGTGPDGTGPDGTGPDSAGPSDGQQPEDGQEGVGGISVGDVSSRVKEFLGKIAGWMKNAWGRLYQKYLEYKESNPGEISDPESLVPVLLEGESDEVATTAIVTVTPEVGALVIMQYPEDKRVMFISTIAAMGAISAGEIQKFRDALPDELKPIIVTQSLSGPELASRILNIMSPEESRRILSLLDEETRSKLSGGIFSFDSIENMEDSDLKLLISNIDTKVLITASLTSGEGVFKKIESVLSADEKKNIQAVADSMDSAPGEQESKEAKQKIVEIALVLEAEGKITLPKSSPGSSQGSQGGQASPEQGQAAEETPEDIDIAPVIAAINKSFGPSADTPERNELQEAVVAAREWLTNKEMLTERSVLISKIKNTEAELNSVDSDGVQINLVGSSSYEELKERLNDFNKKLQEIRDEEARQAEIIREATKRMEDIDAVFNESVNAIYSGIRYLDQKSEDRIWAEFTDENFVEAILRASGGSNLSPEEIESKLPNELKGFFDYSRKPRYASMLEFSGKIMADLGQKRRNNVASMLKEVDPELLELIREHTLDFETIIVNTDDEGVKSILREVNNDQLLKALKMTKSEIVLTKIYGVLSKKASEMLMEDVEVMGPVPRIEAEQAQKDIANIALKLEADGVIKISRPSDPSVEYV